MKISDVIKLPELSGFKLVSGRNGIDREVYATEIIDFEFCKGIEFTREEMFYGNSLGLSSLMYAKDDPELLLESVKQLYSMGVSCLCYKPIFYKELPKEVLEFSESNAFPIFEIIDDAFFEDIVLAVKKEAGLDMTETEVETTLEKVIRNEADERDISRLKRVIAPDIHGSIRAVCFEGDGFDREAINKYIRRLSLLDKYSGRVALVRFRRGGLFFLEAEDSAKTEGALFKDVTVALDLSLKDAIIGISTPVQADLGLPQAIREAELSMRVAKSTGSMMKNFEELGAYRLLAPAISSGDMARSVKGYLKPLEEGEKSDEGDRGILLNTAVEFVLSDLDYNKTAKKLYCHKNTIRYRIKRIHSILDPKSSEVSFLESLTIAVRIYILKENGEK